MGGLVIRGVLAHESCEKDEGNPNCRITRRVRRCKTPGRRNIYGQTGGGSSLIKDYRVMILSVKVPKKGDWISDEVAKRRSGLNAEQLPTRKRRMKVGDNNEAKNVRLKYSRI